MKVSLAANLPIRELLPALDLKIKKLEATIESLEGGKDNPSVKSMYHERLGNLEALIAVRDLVKGNRLNFNLL
jgi:hypothetical protein